ncbi:hypothetical protein BKA69DRAFT_1123837 [Paraphysoderma sedebokerense]|nr:hypothetical protein BKA69DRAFT_1123837 [Paraphysoderma sedebokerense]
MSQSSSSSISSSNTHNSFTSSRRNSINGPPLRRPSLTSVANSSQYLTHSTHRRGSMSYGTGGITTPSAQRQLNNESPTNSSSISSSLAPSVSSISSGMGTSRRNSITSMLSGSNSGVDFKDISPTDPIFHKYFASKLSITAGEIKVLLVDDDLKDRALMTNQLTKSGYPVETANNGIQALQILQNSMITAPLNPVTPFNAPVVSPFSRTESGTNIPSPSLNSSSAQSNIPPITPSSASPNPSPSQSYSHSPSQPHTSQLPSPLSRMSTDSSINSDASMSSHIGTEGNFTLTSEFSIVITDISMPGQNADGIELLKRIRADEKLMHLPVIVMASPDEMELVYSCLRAGADDYLIKPIRTDAIRGVWRSVWRKRKEKKVFQLLEEERAKRRTLEVTVDRLQDQVSAAIDTPLNLITKTVGTLLQSEGMSEESKLALGSILHSLKSSNLYRPAFEKLLVNETLDAETKAWLASEVLRESNTDNFSLPEQIRLRKLSNSSKENRLAQSTIKSSKHLSAYPYRRTSSLEGLKTSSAQPWSKSDAAKELKNQENRRSSRETNLDSVGIPDVVINRSLNVSNGISEPHLPISDDLNSKERGNSKSTSNLLPAPLGPHRRPSVGTLGGKVVSISSSSVLQPTTSELSTVSLDSGLQTIDSATLNGIQDPKTAPSINMNFRKLSPIATANNSPTDSLQFDLQQPSIEPASLKLPTFPSASQSAIIEDKTEGEDEIPPDTDNETQPATSSPDSDQPSSIIYLPPQIPDISHLELLHSWSFDVWNYTHGELMLFLVDMFAAMGALDTCMVHPENFLDFLGDVEKLYSVHGNAYHNFRHAFDVTQAGYLFLRNCCDVNSLPSTSLAPTPPPNTPITPTLADSNLSYHRPNVIFTPNEQLAFLLACTCHDLGHDGRTNNFHIQTSSPLALLYNDQSPLENYHCHQTFLLLNKHNIFINLPKSQQMEIRNLIIRCILATDLVKHVEVLARFNEITGLNGCEWKVEDKEHRARCMEMLMKCADVSNVIRPLHLAKGWSDCIQEEMFNQGDTERSLKLSISPFMDRTNPSQARLGLSFNDYMCTPLFKTIAKVLPKMEDFVGPLRGTREYWMGILSSQEKEKEREKENGVKTVEDAKKDDSSTGSGNENENQTVKVNVVVGQEEPEER